MSTRSLGAWARRSRPPRRRLAEAIGISLLAGASSIALLGGSGLLVGKAAGGGGLAALGALLIGIELVAFVRAPLRYEERLITHRVALGSMVRWRSWLFDVIAERLPGSLATAASGELLDRALHDVEALDDLYVRIALPVLTAVATGVLGVVAVALVATSAALVLLVGIVLSLFAAVAVARGTGPDVTSEAAWRGVASARTVDLVDGLAELMMAGQAEAAIVAVEEAEAERAQRARRAGRRRGTGMAAVGLLGGGTVVLVALLAAAAAHRHSLGAPEAAAISLVAVAAVEPLLGVVLAALRLPEVAASAARLDELAATPLSFTEPERPVPWPTGGAIVLRDVTAAAVLGGPLVLRSVSLRVSPGERIALRGVSGAGKSTICSLVLRFLDPVGGSISIGTTPLSSITSDEVRQHVALLDQSPTLFGGTLGDALRLGDPAATDAELLEALDAVELGSIATAGLASSLAEAGASLSGGQQRRLASARVLLRRPEVLLLDEPTAGLDPEQGRSVLARCLEATRGAAVVLLTHRVAETEGFDRIYRLEDGVLIELDEDARRALVG